MKRLFAQQLGNANHARVNRMLDNLSEGHSAKRFIVRVVHDVAGNAYAIIAIKRV